MNVIDLCAGPGGASEGIKMALPDAKVVGIEFDQAACDTARAAGHHRILADMTDLDPADFHEADYLHASPPCQGFSLAGKGAGRLDGERLLRSIELAAANRDRIPEIMAQFDGGANDHRSVLTLEPLRWVAEIMPEYVTLEQVPTVRPIWDAYRDTLAAWGYTAWTGVLHAEQHGVPQTRRRAVLMARKGEHTITPPTPTHSRYYNRSPEKMDEGVLPWVSMAQALGWTDDTVIESNYGTGGDPKNRGQRTSDQPAPTMTSKAGRNKLHLRNNTAKNAAVRHEDTPAPTMYFGARLNKMTWEDRLANPTGEAIDSWPSRRPSTTVTGSFKPEIIRGPGYRKAGDGPCQNAPGGLRVTVQEAGVLQSFPKDYPWKGTKSKQFEQIGNAVPPLLMAAVVKELMK